VSENSFISYLDTNFATLNKSYWSLHPVRLYSLGFCKCLLIIFRCRYLPKVFDQFAGAQGFLFLHDHVVLNYWNLLNADKAKLWITNQVHIHVMFSRTIYTK